MHISKIQANPQRSSDFLRISKSRSFEKQVFGSKLKQNDLRLKIENKSSQKRKVSSRKNTEPKSFNLKVLLKQSGPVGMNVNKNKLSLSNKENDGFLMNGQRGCKAKEQQQLNELKERRNFRIVSLLKKSGSSCQKSIKLKRQLAGEVEKNEQKLQLQKQINAHVKIQGHQNYNKSRAQFLHEQEKQSVQPTSLVQNFKPHWFQIQAQFSVHVHPKVIRTSTAIQTELFTNDDKYFMQYAKLREMKLTAFDMIQHQEDKLKNILESLADFKTNSDDLVTAINEGPKNDRENRVYGLSKDLIDLETKLNEAFNKIEPVAEKVDLKISQNIHQVKQKRTQLFQSIQHLVEACLLQKRKQNMSNSRVSEQNTFDRILQRVKNQLSLLRQLVLGECAYGIKSMSRYRQQILDIKQIYDKFMGANLENRVMLYTLIKQIEKIPALMITLFGYDAQADKRQEQTKGECLQSRISQFMDAKCLECYQMQKKIKILQFHNQKIKPVFKSLEWLIRDCTKNQCCLTII